MHVYLRGGLQQKLRLLSGFILFAFATAHFLNHALGLISLEVMHEAQEIRTAITRSTLGTVVLVSALTTHIALALYKVSQRQTWRIPRWEAIQIASGLAIPFLLFPHIVNTRIAHQVFGVHDIYLYELIRLWPDSAITQSLLLLLVWTHGCMGLHYWLRLSDGYGRVAPALLALAVAIPVLALAGFAVSGRATGEIMSDRAAFAMLKERTNWPNAEESATLGWLRMAARLGFLALAGTAIGAALVRRASRAATPRKVRISYIGGPTIGVAPGQTLLEISRSAGIAHASVCGGRGRCSTCRVRVEEGLDSLPRPSGTERATLRSIEAPANVRLACQILPAGDLTIALISGPATPGPPQDSFDDVKEFVSAHVRGILDDRLVDFRSQDPAAVTEWLFQEGTEAVAVRDLAASGYRLEGVRIEFVMNRRMAALVYQWQAHFITLFQSLQHESALAMRGQRNGYHLLAWTDDGLAFVAVSEVEAEELDRLQEALRPSEPALRMDANAAVL